MNVRKDYRMDFLIVGAVSTSTILFLLLTHHISDLGGVILAVISGLWASFTTLLFEELLKQNKFSKRLKCLNGIDWKGYNIKERELDSHISNVQIEYQNDTLLRISVTEIKDPKTTWTGCIEMNEKILNKGAITYKYDVNHESGYKEILLEEDENTYYLYLFPVTNEMTIKDGNKIEYKYGVEVFVKNKSK